jgi:hypothetical protein
VYPGQTIHTQYSTTSTALDKVLGVESTLAV